MQYEVVYEDGSYSLAEYENDEEALAATKVHHERALEGGPALLSDPIGAVKATRIVKIVQYDSPPGDIFEAMALPEDQVKAELEQLITDSSADGVTDLRILAARVRDLSNPIANTPPHESNYKAEGRELELPWA